MKRLKDRKLIWRMWVMFILLLWVGFAQAESSVPKACGSNGLSAMIAGADISGLYHPTSEPVVGHIKTMVGRAVVLRKKGKAGFIARQGDAVHRGDTLFTDAGSTLRLKFKNMDVAIMGACANLHIASFHDDQPHQQKSARMKSSRGNLLFYVLRLFGYQKITFEVQTPSRVASVRGTKFGVSVAGTLGNHVDWLMAGTPMQKTGTTDCFCDSGSVKIDQHIVHAGIIYRDRERAIDLLTVKDTDQFKSAFYPPLIPYVMNAITPPGYSGGGEQDKAKGPEKSQDSANPDNGHPHGGPPGQSNTDAHPHGGPPGQSNPGANPHGGPPGQSNPGANPHGGPPGQSNPGGNPHGGPPGQQSR